MLGFAVIIGAGVILIGAIVVALISMWVRHTIGKGAYRPFRRAPSLLPDHELAWYHALARACEGFGVVHCRVRAWDLVFVPKDTPHPKQWRDRVWHKYADMVVCDLASLRPLAVVAIESSPGRGVSARIDDLRLLCTAAGLPMLLIHHDQTPDALTLRAKLQTLLRDHPGQPAADQARAQLDSAGA